MKRMRLYMKRILGMVLILSVCSCEKLLDVDTSTTLGVNDHYSAPGEVYGAFIGIAGSFMKVADQTIILSELKGDLLKPTLNASQEFWDIYNFRADKNTAWAGMGLYYDIIINCNDFLKRARKFNRENPGSIPSSVYEGMVSNAICYKAWSLFTIAKFSGEATVYSVNADSDDSSSMVQMRLEDLIPWLMDYLKNGEEGIDGFVLLNWKDLLDNQDVNWEGCQINGNALMAELNLWAGNYEQAVAYYIEVITNPVHPVDAWKGTAWGELFRKAGNELEAEVITLVPFDASQGHQHKLRYYFSNISPNAYYLAPTENMLELFDSQRRQGFYEGDLRGNGLSVGTENNERVVLKYSLKTDIDAYTGDANIHIYRAAEMHLNLAEAYCFLGRYEEALAFLDNGMAEYWNGSKFDAPFESFNSNLRNNAGVRGRMSLLPVDRDVFFEGCTSRRDSITTLAAKIADENALELAYEGKRWFALVRMARNLQDPSFLADRVAAKFQQSEQAYYKTLLTNQENWFIKE